MDEMIFRGTGTALITPFCEDGVDYESLGRIIDFQIDSGADFLVVLGTTGESPTVTAAERREIISYAAGRVRGRVPLVAGAGGNCTERVAENCREAYGLGAEGALVVTPYYNKPSQEGLYRHYREITRISGIPVIAYNVPGRTGVNITPETALRIASLEGVAGIKEASGDISQADGMTERIRHYRPGFSILSGNDDHTFHIICSGGHGTISTLSNIAPAKVARMIGLTLDGDTAAAREIHFEMLPLIRSLFSETNPMPLKYAAYRMGLCENILRLPLVPASDACMERIGANLVSCGLLNETEESVA